MDGALVMHSLSAVQQIDPRRLNAFTGSQPRALAPQCRRLLTGYKYCDSLQRFLFTQHRTSLPTMSLSTLTQYWPARHTHKSLSNLDPGVAVLATSFVSYRRQFVPGRFRLSHHFLSMLGVSLDFPVL